LALIALVNLAFVSILFASQNSYLAMLIFPIPVFPVAYLGIKGLAYWTIRRHTITPLRWPVRILFLSMFVHFIVCLFAYTEFEKINPTESHLEEAIRSNHNGLLDAMLWISVSREPIMTSLVNTSIAYDNDDALRRLIRRGADPLQPYQTWRANRAIQWRIAKWRLDNGVRSPEFGQSMTEGVAGSGLAELEYGLKKGFEPKDHPGVLHVAFRAADGVDAKELQREIALLLERGAPVNGYSEGMTPVYALILAKPDLSRLLAMLIEKGADLNVHAEGPVFLEPDGIFIAEGLTPLMLAARTNRAQYISMLLEHGAVKSSKDAAGLTALDYARKLHAAHAMALLEK
jgi:hypothetical protein